VLFIAPENLDFGVVWAESAFKWTLPIQNRGTEPVSVERFLPTCNCVAVSPPTVTIGPGETTKVVLTLDLTAKTGTLNGTEHVPFQAGLGAAVQKGTHYVALADWTLTGRIKPLAALTPASVNLGRLSNRAPLPSPSLVEVHPNASLRYFRLVRELPSFDVEVRQPTLNFSGSLPAVSVRPKPRLDVGVHQQELQLAAMLDDDRLVT
jgi:hypothetical protein